MSFAEMMRADWRDIIEWHELAVKVLVNEPGIQGLLSSLPWADADGREKIMDKAIKQNVLLGEDKNSEKSPDHQTKEEYLKRIALLRGVQGGKGRIKFDHGL